MGLRSPCDSDYCPPLCVRANDEIPVEFSRMTVEGTFRTDRSVVYPMHLWMNDEQSAAQYPVIRRQHSKPPGGDVLSDFEIFKMHRSTDGTVSSDFVPCCRH